ncbi:MAG: hypothetical protein IPP65_08485 [Chlorobi bacterium]|nr:hypothetical protein [Chlorobiota bacterium]
MGTTISVTGAVFSNTTSGGGPAFLTASVTSASCQNQTTGALVNQINNPNAKFYNGPGVTFSNLGAVPNLNGIPKSDFADNCSFNMVASLNGGNIGSCSTGEIQCVWGSSLPFTGTNGGALAAGINLTITPTDICDGPITLSGSVTGFGCNDGLGGTVVILKDGVPVQSQNVSTTGAYSSYVDNGPFGVGSPNHVYTAELRCSPNDATILATSGNRNFQASCFGPIKFKDPPTCGCGNTITMDGTFGAPAPPTIITPFATTIYFERSCGGGPFTAFGTSIIIPAGTTLPFSYSQTIPISWPRLPGCVYRATAVQGVLTSVDGPFPATGPCFVEPPTVELTGPPASCLNGPANWPGALSNVFTALATAGPATGVYARVTPNTTQGILGDISFTWYRNGIPFSTGAIAAATFGANIDVYLPWPKNTLAKDCADDGAAWQVLVQNSCGSVASNAFTTVIKSPPTVSGVTISSTTVCKGDPFTISGSITGTDACTLPATVQFLRGGTVINSQTITSGTIPSINVSYSYNTSVADNGQTFQIRVTNSCGTVTSAVSAALSIVAPPVIELTGPAQICSPTVWSNVIAAITPSVTGLNIGGGTGQWYLNGAPNGAPIAIATGATATVAWPLNGVASACSQSGGTWQLLVTNACGTYVSNTFETTVVSPPTIGVATFSPNSPVCNGTPIYLSVPITGVGCSFPLTVEFKRGATSIGTQTITTGTFPITVGMPFTASAGDNGATYTIDVSNTCASVTSTTGALVIVASPVILLSGPAPICSGTNWPSVLPTISSSIAASGVLVGDSFGAWYVDGVLFSVPAVPPNANYLWPLSGTAANCSQSGQVWKLLVTNPCGTSVSSEFTLKVVAPPTMGVATFNPASPVCVGTPIYLSADITGVGCSFPLTVEFKRGGTSIGTQTITTGTFPITVGMPFTASAGDNGATYTIDVSNTCASVTSTTGALSVIAPPVIELTGPTQICSPTAWSNVNATITPSITGLNVGGGTGQWYLNGAPNGAPIAIATGATATVAWPLNGAASACSQSGGTWQLLVTNACGTYVSNTFVTTVVSPPTMGAATFSPASPVCVGTSMYLSAEITGVGCSFPLTVEFKRGATSIGTQTITTGTFPITLGMPFTASAGDNGATYTIDVSNTCASVTSTTGALTVNAKPILTTQPTNMNICLGDALTDITAVISVDPVGLTLPAAAGSTYTWLRDGAVDVGPTNVGATPFTVPVPTTPAAAGSYDYQLRVTTNCGTVLSNIATVIVGPNIVVSPVAANTAITICNNQSVSFGVVLTTGTSTSYTWTGAPVGSVNNTLTSSAYTTPSLTSVGSPYVYTVTIAGCGGPIVKTFTITVQPTTSQLTIVAQPVNVMVCAGVGTTFTSTVNYPAGPIVVADWYRNGIAITGQTGLGTASGVPNTLTLAAADVAVQGATLTPTLAGNNGDQYQVCYRITNGGGGTCNSPVCSNIANLTVKPTLTGIVSNSPTSQTVCLGQPVTFGSSLTSQGTPNLPIGVNMNSSFTFQWYKINSAAAPALAALFVNANELSGAVSSTYTSPATTQGASSVANAVNSDWYGVEIRSADGCGGPLQLGPVLLTVVPTPVIIDQPSNLTVCEGANLPASAPLNAPPPGVVDVNATATFGLVTVTGMNSLVNPLSYEWFRNGISLGVNSLPGAFAPGLANWQVPTPIVPRSFLNNNGDLYYVRVYYNTPPAGNTQASVCGSVISNSVRVVVVPDLTGQTATISDVTVCLGSTATFTPQPSATLLAKLGSVQYQWYKGTAASLIGDITTTAK